MNGRESGSNYAEIGYLFGDGSIHYVNTKMTPAEIQAVQSGFWESYRKYTGHITVADRQTGRKNKNNLSMR